MIKSTYLNSATVWMVVALLASCKHESGEALPQKKAFEHVIMKPWFDTHCGSCHATGRSNYLNWHYDSQDYNATFDEHHREHIYERVYIKKDMPKNVVLSVVEIEKFKTWADAGFPAK